MEHTAGEGVPSDLAVSLPRPAAPVASPAEFDALYAANFERLVMQLYAYTGDLAQAQDVVQESFARAVPRWNKLSTYDDPVAWVRRVAWNLATSRWRQLRRFNAFARQYRPEPVAEPSPDRVAINTALATLPPKHRRVVVMYYLADMSVSEIAAHERMAEGTVKSWLYRARATLAAQLADAREEGDHA